MADLLLTKAHDQVTAALESLFLVRIPGPNPYQAVSDAIDEAIKVHKRKVAHLVPARVEAAATATHQLSRSVLVTPLRVVPQLPEPKEGNRILRKYEAHLDRFLRVSLADEDRSSYYSARCKTMFEEWITPWIHSPMVVGGRSFVFLAYSNSQLREQSCWFYDEQPRPDSLTPPTAEEIRQNIGDLSAIHIPGKYGARLGQAFSTTTAATQVPVALTREIPDVERNGYCFSDGVGRMSPSLAEKIAGPLKVDTPPTAVQIRYQGCKGVVTLDPRLEGSDIQLELRPSMNKFTCSAEDSTLEVCNFARPSVFYLNRQTIVLMTALGVPDSAIEKHFQVMKDELEAAVIDDKAALQFMQSHAASTMVPMMLRSGFSIKSDRHLRELVAAQRNSLLLDLKNRARIRVPESVLMLGVMDEWNVLGPDEVYLSSNSDLFPLPPAGTRVLVGRSPSLHPGDLRLATLAAERPELAHLKEVIVFPQTGDRPLCNMMSGGDLDGDQFFCIWDKTLIPDHQVPPMEYEASSSVAAAINRAATKVDIEDVCKFFVDYMENDIVGALCNLHLAYADLMSAASPPCLQLAHIYTTAIDWPKTGVRAVLPPTLRRIARPDFMEAEFLDVYRSEKILGRIYRAMKDMASRAFAEYDRFSPECLEQALTGNVKPFDNGYDPTLTAAVPDHQRYMAEARDLYNAYALDWIKRSIMHDVHDEAELAIGFFRQAAMKKIRRKNWDESVSMVLDDIIALRNEYCDYFWDEFEESLPEKFVDLHQQSLWRESRCDRPDVVAKAVAWYRVAYEVVEDANPMNDRPVGAAAADPEVAEHIARLQYLGFAWLVPQPICRVKAGLVRKAADAVRWARR
ncbi:RNA dependent RNA polymerase-domain-containing protein [Blastocladiella britannica]|nr:RNA dependent RNA polymerase-domain-containing protein [Blastocladiella britannica]